MIKFLRPVGNSLGLVIERPILKLLGVDRETPLEVTVEGNGLLIRPAPPDHKARVRASAERLSAIHRDTLEKLAQCDPSSSTSTTSS